jgi:Cof subfamily protein (haloacid dehalogenase superfamily)
MYRLLATDIDDTLLAPDGSLPEANRTALRRLHETGVTIVFCSGRADASIQTIASPILEPADDEYYIAFNGARIVTALSRRVVSRRYLSPATIAPIVAYARKNGLHVQGYREDEFLVESDDGYTRMYAAATSTEPTVVPDLAAALPAGSPKLLIIGTHEELVPHRARLAALGGDDHDPAPAGAPARAGAPSERFSVMFSKPKYLEVVAEGVDKGDALRRLAATLEIPIEQTIAVGDGDNDVAMIRAAGLGLAVASAHESARAAADELLKTGAEDGAMAEIVDRYFTA